MGNHFDSREIEPIFEVFYDNGVDLHIKIYADGSVEGLPSGARVMNRIPAAITSSYWDGKRSAELGTQINKLDA